MNFHPWNSNTWLAVAFLAVILIVTVVLQMKRYFTERRFRKDWERSTGRRWESYGQGSDRGEGV